MNQNFKPRGPGIKAGEKCPVGRLESLPDSWRARSLSLDGINEIRRLRFEELKSYSEISRLMHISQSHICLICNGRAWNPKRQNTRHVNHN